jgi:hydrogenase-4 component B
MALLCVALGVGASVVAPVLAQVATSLTHGADVTVASNMLLQPGDSAQAMLSPAVSFLLLIALPVLPLVVWWALRGDRGAFRRRGEPWACGYAWEEAMSASAGSFTQPLRVMFAPLYRMRKQLDPSAALNRSLTKVTEGAAAVEPFWDDRIIWPLVRLVQRMGAGIQRMQSGDFRLYCLYVVVALVILLLTVAL